MNRQLEDGRSVAEVVSLVAIALVVVAAIVGIVYWVIGSKQKAQLRTLAQREPGSFVFTSFALQNVAAFVKAAIPALGLEKRVKGVNMTSPTAVANADGFRLVYGGSKLDVAYSIPRERISDLAIGEVREGIHTYATIGIAVTLHGEPATVIPVAVARPGSTMRRASAADAEDIAMKLASLWGVSAPRAETDEATA